MKFDIIKKDQYLNVCVWSRSQEKNEKDILLGYVSKLQYDKEVFREIRAI